MHHQISQLNHKNEELNYQIAKIEENYKERISKMQNDLIYIVNQKENECKKKISDIYENSFQIPKDILDKNKYLYYLILYTMGNAPSNDFVNFCNLIYLNNPRTFKIFRNFLMLMPERTLRSINSPEKNYLKFCLTELEGIQQILFQFYPDACIEKPVHLTLGGDAASIKTILESGLSSFYNFMALPLEKKRKTASIHVCPTNNGTSSKEIVEKCEIIINLIESEKKFVIDFVATDGDGAFDYRHVNFFNIIEPILNENLSFEEKLMKIKDFIHIPVNDPLHLYKNGRSHLLNHILLVDPDSFKCVNLELFQKATQITNAINDRSSIAAMKDSYALEIFSWDSLVKLLNNNRFDAAFYILPFCFMIQATNSEKLNRNQRLSLLHNSLKLFMMHLSYVRKSSPTDFFTPSFTENSIGTLFGEEIFIIRCINTCIACAVLMFKMDDAAFSRIGTHDIEIFFGRIRLLSFFNYTFDNALRSAINSIIFNRISNEIGYKYKIRDRINESGIFVQQNVLLSENDDLFNFDFLTDTIVHFLKGDIISQDQYAIFMSQVNEYTEFTQNTNSFNYQSVFSGTSPHHRLTTINYAKKILQKSANEFSDSPFSCFVGKNKNKKKEIESNKFSATNWLFNLLQLINLTKEIQEPIDYINLLIFNEEINLFTKKIIVGWLNGMILLLIPDENDSNEISSLNQNEKELQIKNIIVGISTLFEDIIENRSKRFKQSIEEYAKQNLIADLNVILQFVQNNFQKNISTALNEMEQTISLGNDKNDDITENIYDFSVSISESDEEYDDE